jgi:hypothetical protein
VYAVGSQSRRQSGVGADQQHQAPLAGDRQEPRPLGLGACGAEGAKDYRRTARQTPRYRFGIRGTLGIGEEQ